MNDTRLSALVLLLLRHRKSVVQAAVLGGVIGVVLGLSSGMKYKASATFMVQSSQSSLEGLAGLASQFGVRVPRTSAALAPEFYRDLLTSQPVLSRLASQQFTTEAQRQPLPLSTIAGTEGANDAETQLQTLEWLREEVIRASVSRETGVIRLTVLTESAQLSYNIADSLLSAAAWYDLTARRSQARAEREFLSARADSASAALQSAESDLQSFLTKNRSYRDSPALSFEFDRLNRNVSLRQQLYTSLAQALEQARIEEVRSTPVLNIVERPVLPVLREPRGTVTKAVGLSLGLALVWCVALIITTAFRQSEDSNLVEARSILATLLPQKSK